MCDYSMHAVQSRPAEMGEKLITSSFRNSSTSGFAAQDNREVAVCLLPGTELAFEEDVKFYHRWIWSKSNADRGGAGLWYKIARRGSHGPRSTRTNYHRGTGEAPDQG